jgi:6,7-dimethyl-8-ribityllumazine synthase
MKAKSLNSKNVHKDKRIAIVASQFNEYITERLLKACLNELSSQGVPQKNIETIWVPGSFEIPVTALKLAKQKEIHAVICLGAVIRGETYHFEVVAHSAAQGVLQASLSVEKPIIFGILTTNTVDQAEKRSQNKGDNKGCDAAQAALTMIDVMRKF